MNANTINIVDVMVIIAVLLFAWSGWRQGFVAALLSFAGFIGGGLLGSFLAPWLLRTVNLSGAAGLAATAAIVLGLAITGQVCAGILGRRLRAQITIEPVRVVDNVAGSVLNVLALAVIAWILASTAAALPASPVAAQVRTSTLLGTLDSLVPTQARDLMGDLRGLVDDSGLPQLFDSFGVLPPPGVDAPTTAVIDNPAVQRALASVVRVEGPAPSCNSGFTGSGFVVAPGRVLTNAHVVAGVPEPRVHVPNRTGYLQARTVYFDPRVDVAVLDVPGLTARALTMSGPANRGDDTIIAGYPGGGPMTAVAARVRGTISSSHARGTDIYGRPGVAREIYALRGVARQGNSGGPLLAADGTVLGVVFAQAQGDPQTAYALTADQVAPAIRLGSQATISLLAGACPS